MNGAAILYNLFLAELEPRRDSVIEECTAILDEWLALLGHTMPSSGRLALATARDKGPRPQCRSWDDGDQGKR